MGFFRRMFMEKARRSVGGGKDFEPTTNDRLDQSYREAKRFEILLRQFDAKCSQHLRAIRQFDEATQAFMISALPRMHVECEDGKVLPVGEQRAIGADIDTEEMARKQEEGREQIYQHVEQPIRLWLASFRAISLSMKELSKQRLVIDSRRRELKHIQAKVQREQENLPEGHTSTPKMNKLIEEGHKKEAKLTEAQALFAQQEEMTYGNMETLVNDARFVQAHLKRMFDLLSSIGVTEAELMTPATEALTQGLTSRIGQNASDVHGVPGASVETPLHSARYAPLQEAVAAGFAKTPNTPLTLNSPVIPSTTSMQSGMSPESVVINHEPTYTHQVETTSYAGAEPLREVDEYVTPAKHTSPNHVNVYVPEGQAV